jgi:hypothetical protein
MRVGLATCSALADGYPDDHLLADALVAAGASPRFAVWDDRGVEWSEFDLVVVRSAWDYTSARDAFLAWSEGVGDRLRNSPGVLRWNSDKRYLAELASEGIEVVPTTFVDPDEPLPTLEGEVVVKPAVSAGGRDTGRFSPRAHAGAGRLIARLREEGRTTMVQPYLESVEREGETSIVSIAGSMSHVLRKQAVLRPDEVAPTRDDGIGAAEVMYDEELVVAGSASPAQMRLGNDLIGWLAARFGEPPLYARVDMLGDSAGEPVLVELEVIEPCLYLATSDAAPARLAAAILDSR